VPLETAVVAGLTRSRISPIMMTGSWRRVWSAALCEMNSLSNLATARAIEVDNSTAISIVTLFISGMHSPAAGIPESLVDRSRWGPC